MHFTREPIIETVITPREGCKIILRNSKGNSQEEYTVEAVEVVSFGNALFFRSQEKPKAFLLPVSDYELIETKETRVILKSISLEKSIKIGGGREASMRIVKEPLAEKEEEEVGIRDEAAPRTAEAVDPKLDKRRDRRRHRRRRSSDERHEMKDWTEKKEGEPHENAAPVSASAEGGGAVDETLPPVSSPIMTSLIPPPSTLISETIARYKDAAFAEGAFLSKKVEKTLQEKHEEVPMAPLHMLSPPIEEEEKQSVSHHIFDEEQ